MLRQWLHHLRLLGLVIRLVCGSAYLDAALHQRAIFHADALGDDISRERTFAANVQPVGAFDVSADFAHDHDFAGVDVGLDGAVASDGHPVFRDADAAFNAAINIKCFGAVTSPLITIDLPMVACSSGLLLTLTGA